MACSKYVTFTVNRCPDKITVQNAGLQPGAQLVWEFVGLSRRFSGQTNVDDAGKLVIVPLDYPGLTNAIEFLPHKEALELWLWSLDEAGNLVHNMICGQYSFLVISFSNGDIPTPNNILLDVGCSETLL